MQIAPASNEARAFAEESLEGDAPRFSTPRALSQVRPRDEFLTGDFIMVGSGYWPGLSIDKPTRRWEIPGDVLERERAL
jgi:hypothetical protein